MPRILFVHSVDPSFVRIDRDALRERWELEDLFQPGRAPNPIRVLRGVVRADLVFGWFASWHTFLPITLAWLLRKPSVLIIGGFDTACERDIGYGYQRGGPQRLLARWVMRRARRLVTNSFASQAEIERTTGIARELVTVVQHGVPDPFGELPSSERERLALSVGVVVEANLERKGHRAFVETAALLEDVEFVLAGKWGDEVAIERLRSIATPNVRFTGWIEQDELDSLYRRAKVYVQPSAHEGFGLSVAEGMLAGCIPVVSDRGALPEVVGRAGVVVHGREAAETADGVRRALALGPGAGAAARERITATFPLERRVRELQAVVAEELGEAPASQSSR